VTPETHFELDHRVSQSVHVRLLWWPVDDRISIEVVDEARGDSFALVVPNDRALDAFHHPYAYAAPDASITDYLEQARAA